MSNNYVDKKNVLSFAGAFIALLIGSGFATGQEIMQYFASYGWYGFIGIAIAFIILILIGYELIHTGYDHFF